MKGWSATPEIQQRVENGRVGSEDSTQDESEHKKVASVEERSPEHLIPQ